MPEQFTGKRWPNNSTLKEWDMNIAIIGPGNMGSGLARQFVAAGHKVTLAGRDLAKAQKAAAAVGAKAAAVASAAQEADVIVVATPYGEAARALAAAGNLRGKVVIDITNPITTDYMGLTIGFTTSAAEEIAKVIPGARVVKAFNTVFAQVLNDGPDFGKDRRAAAFYAGDDSNAKATVKALIESTGFEAIDAGPLVSARNLEALASLNIRLGYGLGRGTQIAPTFIERAAA
jgi:8-hydroxy-5-deazaflavin:NADPH oxidoreductase